MSTSFDYIGDQELDAETRNELQEVTKGFFNRPLEKAGNFDWEKFKRNEAFKAIMMPSPLFWVLASFERSFTQKLGEDMYEKFGRAVADANDKVGSAENQHKCTGLQIAPAEEGKIESIISQLKHGDREPDWEAEKQEILDLSYDGSNIKDTGKVTWDLWIEEFHSGHPMAAEIKTPKPNQDQTMQSKRKMLKTIATYKHRNSPTPIVRFVFPFNPYGSRDEYDWWPPQAFFDISESDGMLIDKEFWDLIGGSGTMEGLFNFLLSESEGNKKKLRDLAGKDTL